MASNDRFILLVEDNPNDVVLTLRELKKNQIVNKVVVVRDGAEALDYLFGTGAYEERDLNDLPQVVLLDLKLPKIDGLEVLKRIRAQESTRRFPVVILTSSDDEKDIIDSYKFGANSYVRKPVEFDAFAKAIRALGLYWVLINEAPL